MTSRPLSSPTSRELPDGMAERHATAGGSFRRNRGWLALVMLSLLMAGALSGLLGGVHNRDLSIDTPAAAMRVHAPAVLRNGEFFEFRVQITARRDIAAPVIAISAPYWRDVTINTMVPAPPEEPFSGDAFQLQYAALMPGARLYMKRAGQINHPTIVVHQRMGSLVRGEYPAA